MDRMTEVLSRLRRDVNEKAALLVLDVDHLKRINDSLGLAAGNATLRFLSGLLRDELRREDTAGRISSEKFAILLPGSDLPSAAIFAKRLRKLIAETKPTIAGQPVAITVSIGVSAIDATDSTADQALTRANQALQDARATGLKQIKVATNLPADTAQVGHRLRSGSSKNALPTSC